MVTTPQKAALQVTQRGGVMYQKLKVPLVGVIENMSSVTCPSCSKSIKLFGTGTEELARELHTTVLGRIALNEDISSNADTGVPIVIAKPESVEAKAYEEVVGKVLAFLKECEHK